MYYIKSLLLCCIFISTIANAQNVFQSNQYMLFQPIVNPASMSSYNEVNFVGYYRNQWQGFEGAPTNFGLLGVAPIRNTSITLGGSLLSEQIGIHKKTSIQLDYAYRLQLNLKSALSFSLSPKVNVIKDEYQLIETTVENDPNIGINAISAIAPNASFGMYYYQKRFYIGFSSPNLLYNSLKGNAYTTNFELNKVAYYLHSGYQLVNSDRNNIYTSIYLKTTTGAPALLSGNIAWEGLNEKLLLGLSYRTSKELVALLKVKLKTFTLSYAYQYSLTAISQYNNGSHEVMLNYRLKPKKEAILIAPRF